MPTVFYADDPGFYDDITPQPLKYAQAPARLLGLEVGIIPMAGDPAAPDAPVAMMLRMEPGTVLRRHSHDCYRVEIVVRGSIDVGNGRDMRPGDVAVSAPGEFYGPHTAGPDGSLSVEIFSAAAGMVPGYVDGDGDEAARRVVEALRRGPG